MIEVFVATHREININLPDYCYPIQVNSSLNSNFEGYLHDNWEGKENISKKNESYCELTALYCLWKHSKADIKGLYQYRRLLYGGEPSKCNCKAFEKKANTIKQFCLSSDQIQSYLEEYDVIDEIPYSPCFRTAEQDLSRYCYSKDIQTLSLVIKRYFPNYYETFQKVMSSYHLSYCNIIITRGNILDDYCSWLFDVLNKCEESIDIKGYDFSHKRIFGYFGEILMNVYIKYHNLKEKHVPRLCVFEYTTKAKKLMRLDWLRIESLMYLEKRNISLPTLGTVRIKKYNQFCTLKND